jgi:hypothetical protein
MSQQAQVKERKQIDEFKLKKAMHRPKAKINLNLRILGYQQNFAKTYSANKFT